VTAGAGAGVPVWRAALGCRCPRCGRGKLFAGVLTVRDRCPVCGLDLRAHDSGDGPATLVIFPLGAIIVGLAFWVEFSFAPPLWLHAVLWPVLTVVLAIALMRPMKAGMVALQYKHRASEMGL
jgi:uncharacterized protein (DUF983 family)